MPSTSVRIDVILLNESIYSFLRLSAAVEATL